MVMRQVRDKLREIAPPSALNLNRNLLRSEVCRSQGELLDLTELWKTTLVERV